MKSLVFAPLMGALLMIVSAQAVAQRHDSPGTRHGVVQVSGTGVIKAIDPAGKKVTLEHQAISKFKLEPATHEFDVRDTKALANLKEGDRVDFRLENAGQDLVVVQLRKAK
jgi:Cu/Ag efflux protein CusF